MEVTLSILVLVSLAALANASMYSIASKVEELNPSNFSHLVLQSDSVWIVQFYSPGCGYCQQFVPEYTKVAKALSGVIKVGAVNVGEHNSLGGQYAVRGIPTIKIFGTDKNKPEDFDGQLTAKAIVDGGFAALKRTVNARMGVKGSGSGSNVEGNAVIELTDSNFDSLVLKSDDLWLVEFFAPWCGHCKKLEPHWAQAAAELKGKVKLGAIDVTTNTKKATQFQITGYPTIKVFPSGKKNASHVYSYNGGRIANDIVNWALEKLAEDISAPPIEELVDASVLKTACEGHPLCVVSVLPHILDCNAVCRNAFINILSSLGENYKKKMWGWVWSEAGAQPALEEDLELSGFGYPALAVVNTKKMMYSIFRGSFSNEGIHEFLRDLSYGRGSTRPIKGGALPVMSEVEAWDGKDGELPPEDDGDHLDDPKEEL